MLILEYCALSAGSKPIDEVPTQATYQPGKTGGRGDHYYLYLSRHMDMHPYMDMYIINIRITVVYSHTDTPYCSHSYI